MPRHKTPAPAPPSTPGISATPFRKHESKKGRLSLVAAFDDLCRDGKVLSDGDPERRFLTFVKNDREWRKKWAMEAAERHRLTMLLSDKENEISGKDYQIKQARKFVEQEQRAKLRAEADRESLAKQLQVIKDLLLADGGKTLNNETLERIRTLDRHAGSSALSPMNGHGNHRGEYVLPMVEESAESLLDASDLSFDETREELLNSSRKNIHNNKKRRSSRSSFARRASNGNELMPMLPPASADVPISMAELKERVHRSRQSRESGRRRTNDVELQLDEFKPSAPPVIMTTPTTVRRTFSSANRHHSFQKKKGGMMETCNPCGKRIKFGKPAYKCRDCAVVCHPDCKKDAPLPCVCGISRTPQSKTGNYLADFTPLKPPMVPVLLEYCVKEVEARGIDDVGIYRVAGSEADANEILEKIQNAGKGGLPRLAGYEVHAVTSCIKKFLRSLKEPVIPLSLWQVFVDAANNPDTTDVESAMYQAISELPLPNRDTLAYLILHLQTVAANSKVNKMSVDNLATVVGPTIVGNSSPDPMAIMSETVMQKAVVGALMNISADYWSNFLAVEMDNNLLAAYRTPTSSNTPSLTPDQPLFATPVATTVGPIARRTRSRQMPEQFSKKQQLFQSPVLL